MIYNLLIQPASLLDLRFGIAVERVEALLADKLFAMVEQQLHQWMHWAYNFVCWHKQILHPS